ncbi:MAG TPA: AMP-binding protein [Sporichthyaceae bacterium]|jgi:long-chain acyl-CoA synthetase
MNTFAQPHELLPWAAARYADRTAVEVDGARRTYRELDAAAARCAAGLHGLGVRPGDRVTVFLENRWEWLAAYHGVLRLGAVVNPVNSMLTAEEIAFIVGDAASAVVVTNPMAAAGLLARAGELPSLRRVVSVDDAPSGAVAFDDLMAATGEAPPTPAVRDDDPCSISYTSGTTGHPKGAVQPQRALRTQWGFIATLHARRPDDVSVTAVPLAHVYGNVIVHGMMSVGGRAIFNARFDPKGMLAQLEAERATVFDGVPTMYALMLAEPSIEHTELGALRLCVVGGQVMPAATAEAWLRRAQNSRWAEVWGMTELSGLVTTHPFDLPRAAGSVGISAPGIEVRVADLEDPEKPVPDGTEGELQARGSVVMLEYLNRPDATAETILPSGFLRTGDIGYRDAGGNFFMVDRLKDMLITGGFNVYPAEIERVLAKHPAVAMVGVAGKPDEVKGELAYAYVVLHQGASATAEELIAFCRQTLAAYKVPRAVVFVADLPRTSTGKILRRELRAM